MASDRTCVDCGRAIAYSSGRPAARCGECKRGRRRIAQRPTVTCLDCKVEFDPPGHTGRLPSRCETCRAVRQKQTEAAKAKRWRDANPESSRAAYQRGYAVQRAKPEHLQKKRDRHLAKYGITRSELDAMVEQQAGKCAICGGAPTGKGSRLHVDHCHATGQLRALLCHHCNTLLGLAGDDPARLRAAAEYLEKHT